MNRFGTAVAAAVVLCSGASFAVGRYSKKLDYDAAYIPQRLKVLGDEAAIGAPGKVLLIGDSISERSGIRQLCGREVFNAGVSGARLGDVESRALELARTLKPARIFLAIGTNDAQSKSLTDAEAWAAHYIALVRKLSPAAVVLVPAPVIQPGMRFSGYFSEAHARELNSKLPAIASATGAKLLSRPSIDTIDAVHPSRAGTAVWRGGLNAGCQLVQAPIEVLAAVQMPLASIAAYAVSLGCMKSLE